MIVTKWLRAGNDNHLEDCETWDEVLESAARSLDKSCVGDIVGECVFTGANGRTYVGNVEFVISEASPEYVKEVLEQIKND
jgi:hypothetical protein